jgi:hypothetical protein
MDGGHLETVEVGDDGYYLHATNRDTSIRAPRKNTHPPS